MARKIAVARKKCLAQFKTDGRAQVASPRFPLGSVGASTDKPSQPEICHRFFILGLRKRNNTDYLPHTTAPVTFFTNGIPITATTNSHAQ
jgi:hypothetical protein